MTSQDLRMLLALVATLAASTAVVVMTSEPASGSRGGEHGGRAATLVDDSGTAVPLRHFGRVASGSILADGLLLELCEPERIVGFSSIGFEDSFQRFRFGSRAAVNPEGDVEPIVALAPDLLLVNNFVDPRRVSRLRAAGISVFDLGPMRGLDSLLADIEQVAALLGVAERGETTARELRARMRAIAADVEPERRRSALYLGVHGNQVYGGTTGTSYHDLLRYAGLADVAAERYSGWPSFTSEQILALDPEVVVTQAGRARGLCAHPGLHALRACRPGGKVVEAPGNLLVDPGLALPRATLLVREAVYGPMTERKAAAQ